MIDNFIMIRQIYLSIIGISFAIGLITLVLTIKSKAYLNLTGEFMIYVLLSELLYCISRFFTLVRTGEIEQMNLNPLNLVQICFSIFCDSLTLFCSVTISLILYDTLVKYSSLFSKTNAKIISRCLIFCASFLFTIIIGILQYANIDTAECSILSCHMSQKINLYVIWIFNIIVIILAIIVGITLVYGCKLLKNQKMMEDLVGLKGKIAKVFYQLLLYPFISIFLWFIRLFPQLFSFITKESGENHLYWIPTSIRCLTYSIGFILVQNDLRMKIINTLCCKKRRKTFKCHNEMTINILQENLSFSFED